jgi:hypothetical protein
LLTDALINKYSLAQFRIDQQNSITTSLNINSPEMLLGRLDDADQTIMLFPGWPVDLWDVSFKLHGPLNTTIEATCTAGKLSKLVVVPESRRSAVQVLNCKEV